MKHLGSYANFAEFFKDLRREKELSLRDFCKKAKADPGNISRLEHREMAPPQDPEILGRYANAIGLQEGSSEWYLFFDLAASDHGIIPRDLLEDEEVVKMLPVFFRTLRGQKPTEKEMRDLAEKLKRR